MKDKTIRCALWMKKYNVGLGDFVGISSNNQLEKYVPMLAITYVGSITTIFRPNLNLSKIKSVSDIYSKTD